MNEIRATIFGTEIVLPIKDRLVITYGLNGCGKSTFLKQLAADDVATYYNPLECVEDGYIKQMVDMFGEDAVIPKFPMDEEGCTKFMRIANEMMQTTKIITSLHPFTCTFNNQPFKYSWFSNGERNLLQILFVALFAHHQVIAFDDIESHLHCGLCMRIIDTLLQETDKIYVIATHSPQIVSNHHDESIQFPNPHKDLL